MDKQNDKQDMPDATDPLLYSPDEVEPPTGEPRTEIPANLEAVRPQTIEEVPRDVQVSSGEAPEQVSPTKLRKKSKKIIIVLFALVAVLSTASVLAYMLWYQKPEKVVADALDNALMAETVMFDATMISDDQSSANSLKLSGEMTTRAFYADFEATLSRIEVPFELKGSGMMAESGDYYLKVSNASELATTLIEATGLDEDNNDDDIAVAIDAFASKINDKWVKVHSDDLGQIAEREGKVQECIQRAQKSLQDNRDYLNEIDDLYKRYQFIEVKQELGSKDGSLGYIIDSNNEKAREFAKGLKDTEIYKNLQECDSRIAINEDDFTTQEQTTSIEMWVSRWRHEITEIKMVSEDDRGVTTLTVATTFGDPVVIATPEQYKTVQDVADDIQALWSAFTIEPEAPSAYNEELEEAY